MWHVWRNGAVCSRFWWGNLRERDHWGDQDVDRRIIQLAAEITPTFTGQYMHNVGVISAAPCIKMDIQEVVGTGWNWLRIGPGGWRL
jgi:hypothetical protein